MKAVANSAPNLRQNRETRGRRAETKSRTEEYMNSKHMYQLWRGDTKFGAPKEMTGQERHEVNKKLEMKFFNDKSPNARLWRWQTLDYRPLPKGTTVAEGRAQIRARSIASMRQKAEAK